MTTAVKRQQAQNVPEKIFRYINPHFQSRLPSILEQVCSSLLTIEPAMQDIALQLAEFREYLDFEIQKTQLDIDQEEWKSRADPEKLESDKLWLAKLKTLRDDFEGERLTSTVEQIFQLVDRVKDMFGLTLRPNL